VGLACEKEFPHILGILFPRSGVLLQVSVGYSRILKIPEREVCEDNLTTGKGRQRNTKIQINQ